MQLSASGAMGIYGFKSGCFNHINTCFREGFGIISRQFCLTPARQV